MTSTVGSWVSFSRNGSTNRGTGWAYVNCDSSCSGKTLSLPVGTFINLTAIPSSDSSFGTWSGSCTGNVVYCPTFFLNSGATTSASFNLVDTTPPTLSTTNSGNTWHNTRIIPRITATDSQSGISVVRYNWGSSPSGFSTCLSGGTETSHNADLNNAPAGGTTLHLCARDNAGNVATWSGNYRWENTLPTITFIGDDNWVTSLLGSRFTVQDTGSGLQTIRYSWTTSSSNPTGITSTTCTGGNSHSVTSGTTTAVTSAAMDGKPTTSGTHYLHVCAVDRAGNIRKSSQMYRLDVTVPGVPTLHLDETWIDGDRSFTISGGSDAHSGVAKYQYRSRTSSTSSAPWNSWNSWSGWIDYPGSAVTIRTTSGVTEVQARTVDNVGLVSAETSSRQARVDKTNPTTPTLNLVETWTNTARSFTISGGSDAHSQLLRYEYRTNSRATPTSAWGGWSGWTIYANPPIVARSVTGETQVEARSVDNVGRVSAATSVKIARVDTENPTCASWSPNESPLKASGTQAFTVTCADTGGSDCAQSTYSCTTGSNHGDTCSVTIFDNAGNSAVCTSPPNRVGSGLLVSALDSSSSWFNTQRTATVQVSGGTGGIAHVSYRWRDIGQDATSNMVAYTGCSSNANNWGATHIVGDPNGFTLQAPAGGKILYLCARDNEGNVETWNGQFNWENTLPTCGSWTPNPSLWRVSGSTQVFTLSGSTDTGGSGIHVEGGTCTATGINGETCNVTISDNAGNTQSCQSPPNNVCAPGQTVFGNECRDPVAGQCGSTIDSCTIGTLIPRSNTDQNFEWSCQGLFGGATTPCSVSKCATPYPDTSVNGLWRQFGTPSSANTAWSSSTSKNPTGNCRWGCSIGFTVSGSTCVVEQHSLTFSRVGSGTVTGVSNPIQTNINCGSTCSRSFSHGTIVTLTASPSPGYIFLDWSGAGCSGSGSCIVEMNQVRSVTATFMADNSCDSNIPSGSGVLRTIGSPSEIGQSWVFDSSGMQSCSWRCDSGYIRNGDTCSQISVPDDFTLSFNPSNNLEEGNLISCLLSGGKPTNSNSIPVLHDYEIRSVISFSPMILNPSGSHFTGTGLSYSQVSPIVRDYIEIATHFVSCYVNARVDGHPTINREKTIFQPVSEVTEIESELECATPTPSYSNIALVHNPSVDGQSWVRDDAGVQSCSWRCQAGYAWNGVNCVLPPACGNYHGSFGPVEGTTWASHPLGNSGSQCINSGPTVFRNPGTFPVPGNSFHWNCVSGDLTVSCAATHNPSVCGDGLVTGDQVCDFGSGRNNNLIPSSNERYYSLPDGSLAYGVSRIDYFCDNCIASRNETVYPGGYCGDGVVQHPPEQCDGTLVNTNCQIIGSQYRGFSLGCFVPGHLNQCTYDSSSCLECSNDNFVRCSYEGDGYLLQEYNILQSSPFVCRFDTSDMQWSWRNHPEGLHRINETVVEACGTRFNGQLVDMNCNANQQFYYDGTSLNLRRYIGDSSGITFNVIPDIDAFDPHCFGSVRGEVVDSGEDLFEARVLLYIQDEQGNGQLFRETTTNLNGHFDFGEIPSTRYKIIVQKDGYFSAFRLINLNYNDIKDDLVFDLSQGACQSDCTLGDGFCRAECDGINGCEFLPNTKESFNLVQQGVFRFIGDSYYKTCNELITDPDLILTALASEDVTCVDGTSLFVERRIVLFNAEPAEVYIYICR